MAIRDELKRQKDSNKASLRYYAQFADHRRQQTDLVLATNGDKTGRLAVLGAGNCYDLDLNRLAQRFREIHLVDIDRAAITRARNRVAAAHIKKIHLHAPVDISGANQQLETWRAMAVTPEALMAFPDSAVTTLVQKLGAPFDCVVSCCVISQILLSYRHVMGDNHPLFEAGLVTLIVTHLRALTALTASQGQALLITDVSSDEIAPLENFHDDDNGLAFLHERAQANQIFNYLDPSLMAELAAQDPFLAAQAVISPPSRAWLWRNGPLRTFLVYALQLHRTQDARAR